MTLSEISIENELWSWKSEGISEEKRSVPWKSAIIIHALTSY